MCTEEHSWNSNSFFDNILLFQLQRHSDHHANPARPYQSLRNFENSPQLKHGYGVYLIPMYFSPWIHKIMDPMVAKHYNYDLTKASILPSKREKYLNSEYNKNGKKQN
ncbi:hypothetical protein GKC56_02305 [Neisseriaceae bacterium PsAf]|nr:hypothetical protein [Neisseriaceae bacterium PsAf]